MSELLEFEGFPRGCVQFLEDLKRNNSQAWFERHRQVFEKEVVAPARRFVDAMGARLRALAPRVHADPRIDKSIFRIHRDTRFSRDKSPYKNHLGIWFWEGSGPRMECSGFYFELSPPNLGVYAGVYAFSPRALEEYRRSVVDPRLGKELREAVALCMRLPGCSLGNKRYKRVPRGFDPNHENADLLLYNGFGPGLVEPIPSVLYTARILDHCLARFQTMAPLHRWLLGVTERARSR